MPVTLVSALLLGTGSSAVPQNPPDREDRPVSEIRPDSVTHAVEGRVVEKHAAVGIGRVRVELEGRGRREVGTTGPDGGFRFQGVRTGGYTLRVLGRGYRPRAQYVWVDEDVAVILPVAPAPVSNERAATSGRSRGSQSGPPGVGELRGVVRGGEWGLPLGDAEVLTNRGVATRTGNHGGFDVGGLPSGASVLVSVRAFGYLPLDTVVVAEAGTVHDFQIWRDPTVQRRIRDVVAGLAARADGHGGPVHTLGREALLASHEPTVVEALGNQHGDLVRRVRCVVLDDRGAQPPGLLSRLRPGDLQRIDLFVDPRDDGGVVARIHSRDFVRDLVAGGVEARRESGTGSDGNRC